MKVGEDPQTTGETRAVQISRLIAGMTGVLFLSACADPEVILRGERLPLRAPVVDEVAEDTVEAEVAEEIAEIDTSFEMPAQVASSDWTHEAGNSSHRRDHAAFSSNPAQIWSVNIGQGNNRKHRITSDPVISGGRIYVMDSQSRVSAVSNTGAVLWTRNLTPPEEREGDASGGGVAIAGDTAFATTGFGELIALDASTGAEKWRQRLDAPATSAPTVVGDLVYAVSRDNVAWAIGASDGRVKWQLPGTPDVSGVIGGAAPAVNDRVAVFPFGSGELVAALRNGGVRLWGSAVSGRRKSVAYANVTDITADPVIVGDVVYTASQSGRTVAISMNSGARIWTARDGATGPVMVAGTSLFMVSDQNELIRLNAETGEEIWATELPFFRRDTARRARTIFTHFGPVLAGGQLWVASDSGKLTSYDPETGEERQTLDIPGGAASSMSVADGTMYLLTGRGQLVAYR